MQDEITQQENWDSTSKEKHTNNNKRNLVQTDKFLHKK